HLFHALIFGGSSYIVSSSPTLFRLAARLDDVGFSDIVKIRNKIMELRAKGQTVYQFEGGEPFRTTPEYVKEAMTRALVENKTRYAPSSGIPELRAAIADKLRERNRIPASDADVVVLNGGMQGLFGAFQSVVNPGEEVLVFSPYWTPIKDLIAHCQGSTVLVPSEEARQRGFRETLAHYATERTRAIYYNTPQNPTGIVFTREEAEAVASFARERDLVVISDEAYEDIVYDGEHVSIASLEGMFERTITLFTLSKSYAMTGWRLGYAAATEPWMTGLKKTLLYSTNGVSTPTQWAALAAFNTSSDFLRTSLAAYRERRDLLLAGLNELGLTCSSPAGAFYAFPDCSRIKHNSREAADLLLERAQVATVPGIVFGEHGESHLRFSFSTSLETIEAGLDSMRKNL
ncbi:MAG: pyridoxal phosphate-dependent aminotransferase, partial [Pyrinomonadaceae bacterium]